MSDSSGQAAELLDEARELIAALCDERITPEQLARLEFVLRGNREARRLYVRLMHLHAGLYQQAALLGVVPPDGTGGATTPDGMHETMVLPAMPGNVADAIDEAEPVAQTVAPWVPPRPRGEPWGRRLLWRAGIAAVFLVGIGLATVLVLRRGAGKTSDLPDAIATLSGSIDVTWADGASHYQGESLVVGQAYPLKSGYVQLAFPRGAYAIVEGPATFTVRSASEMSLASGKVSALIYGPAAHGFTVKTPTAAVVDLGTEFGVGVAKDGATDVEVFKGQVSLATSSASSTTTPNAKPAASQIIKQGEARKVDAKGAVAKSELHPAAFVRSGQFDGWIAGTSARPRDRWHALNERLDRDPSLVLHYTLDVDPAQLTGSLPNVAPSTQGRHAIPLGAADAPVPAEGRFPGKGALAFELAKHQRLLLTDYPYSTNGELSVAVWIKPRTRPAWAAIAKSRGNNKGGQFSLGLYGTDGDALVRLFEPDGHDVLIHEGKDHPVPIGKWSHVAFTADASSVRLYRDGKLVASAPCHGVTADPTIRTLSIGARTGDDGVTPVTARDTEFFDGSIDEFTVWHRALTDAQVAELYAAGKPQ